MMTIHYFLKTTLIACLCLNVGFVLAARVKRPTPRPSCTRPHLDKKIPVNLTTVAPGSDFSFVLFGVDSANHVNVSIKQKPIPVQTEFKAPNYIVTGKIPEEFRGDTFRISVKINSLHEACRLDDGWLVNISE